MVGVGTAILVLAALAIAQPVFAPLAFALFIIALVWPLQARLQRRIPMLLALALTMLATVFVVAAFAWVMTWGFTRVARYVVGEAPQLQLMYNDINAWLEGHGMGFGTLWTTYFNVGWVLQIFQEITSRVGNLVSFTVVMLIYVILGLLEVADAARRLKGLKGNIGSLLLASGIAAAAKLRRYMLVRTMMSIMTGVLVWAFIWLYGLPLSLEWGVIAFALNYIPFIGTLVATVLPALFAVAQLADWQDAVMIFVCLNLLQFLVGSYLEPRVAGRVLSMSPFLMLFAVFFWTFLWGFAGAFIGVPIVIALLTLCEQHESSRWVATLLGGSANGPQD
jgi:predicted PurR-regulated permease PerM